MRRLNSAAFKKLSHRPGGWAGLITAKVVLFSLSVFLCFLYLSLFVSSFFFSLSLFVSRVFLSLSVGFFSLCQ